MLEKMLELLHKIFSRIRHPFGITCLDCGFLALDQDEVVSYARILLSCRESAQQPSTEYIRCFKSLWIYLDLIYPNGNYPTEEILGMIEKQQRNCEGYSKHVPGLSPADYLGLCSRDKDKTREQQEAYNL